MSFWAIVFDIFHTAVECHSSLDVTLLICVIYQLQRLSTYCGLRISTKPLRNSDRPTRLAITTNVLELLYLPRSGTTSHTPKAAGVVRLYGIWMLCWFRCSYRLSVKYTNEKIHPIKFYPVFLYLVYQPSSQSVFWFDSSYIHRFVCAYIYLNNYIFSLSSITHELIYPTIYRRIVIMNTSRNLLH